MNSKSKRHKSSNTFRFQTFSERISSIDIDIFHKVKHPYEEYDADEEGTTYYNVSISKWIRECFSPEFTDLCKQLPKDLSLPQLLVQKQEIIEKIINYLGKCETEALQPALELIIAITKDIRKEMYPFFNPSILRECVRLLDTREPDQIEWVFTCLAHLIKYLWLPIVKNIHAVLPELLPLLSHSKPKFINNFAAESFAFAARKVRDKSQFLQLCLRNIKDKPEELSGVAKLFFEVIRSVGNSFHSAITEFLSLILRELSNPKWSNLLFTVCDDLVNNIITFVGAKTNVEPLWEAIFLVANEFRSSWLNNHECSEKNLTMLLKLIKKLAKSRGRILSDPLQLLNFMLPLAVNAQLPDYISLHEIVIDIITVLLVNIDFSSHSIDFNTIITDICSNIKEEDLVIKFTLSLVLVPKYETTVLNMITNRSPSDNLLQCYAKIIWMKTRLQFDYSHESKISVFMHSLSSESNLFLDFIAQRIRNNLSLDSSENLLLTTIVAAHVQPLRSVFILESKRIISDLSELLTNCDQTEEEAKLLYMLFVIHQCQAYVSPNYSVSSNIISLAMKYSNSSNFLCSLRLLNVLSKFTKLEGFDDQKTKLFNNLCSPFHKVRLFTLSILEKMRIHSIFAELYEIECIVATVETYREKLYRLQKLEFNESFQELTPDELVRDAVLKFLIGNLYINFQLIWEPIQKIIMTHLSGNKNCWSTFTCLLKESVENDIYSFKLMENFTLNFRCDFLQQHFYSVNGVDDRPDFYNFRCLLLDVLSHFSTFHFADKCLVPNLFLKFYKSEYAVDAHRKPIYCSIKNHVNYEDFRDIYEDNSKSPVKFKNDSNNKNLNKLLFILLKMMNNSTSEMPHKLRDSIFNIHFELLMNGNSDIQQLAVGFICKVKKMSQYKDRLMLITKENSFKTELLNFRIDFSSDNIPSKDKDFLMKILLKLMFGKVRKKGAINLRDSMFEFLADCDESYIILFLDLFFGEYTKFTAGSVSVAGFLNEEIDIENLLSPSFVLNYINTALDILKRCGKLLKHNCLSYLLKVVMKVASSMVVLCHAKIDIHPRYHGLFSKIRVISFETINYFFEHFVYDWSTDEINAVFQVFIEPWIHKIPEECLQGPNPVMKLFIVFSYNIRYFPLLAREFDGLTPLSAMIGLLKSAKVSFNVKYSVLEIIERLLTLEDEDVISEDSDLLYVDNSTTRLSSVSAQYGTLLVIPHVTCILQYLEKSLAKKHVKLNSLYMLILKRISDFGLDETDSVTLLSLLMPVLKSKANSDEDVISPLMDTIFNLFRAIKTVDLFEQYLIQLAYLFNIIALVSVRRVLCEMLKYICQKSGDKFVTWSFVQGLNLFAKRWVEQPDYAGRLDTFKNINEAAENDKLNLYTGIFVIYNCFYMIHNDSDLSLRDHSGICLKKICPILAKKYQNCSKELDLLLNIVLLPLIRNGIQSNNENVKLESVSLLGHMANTCESVHPVFKCLNILTDSTNLDNDFFENIVHLQNFRRTQALKRFNEIMSEVSKAPSPYCLTFIFPLISPCLLTEKTVGEHGLIGAAVESIKILCRLSSWHHYEKIFKHYIMELRKKPSMRKQAIRIVSAILDSFHFDLKNAEGFECEKIQRSCKKSKSNQIPQLMEIDNFKTVPLISTKLNEPAMKRIHTLSRSDAVRVFRSIKSFLVPSLDRVFMTYEDSEQYHKQSKRSTNNDKEEIAVLSIPIAYAAVKLLKRLPKLLLDQYISTVFLKLSTYLKSRLLSIRLVARETLQNILMEIGPNYFPKLLSEMTSILTKGFQVHVLVSTSHALLEKIKSMFDQTQMNQCIDLVMQICIIDLFGKLAEEKEVVQISSKTPEAKGNKSYNMLSILAEYVGESSILELVLPLKEILFSDMSSKITNKVMTCLRFIALGLTKNRFLDAETLLTFSYGVSNDCIPQLVAERDNNLVKLEPEIKRPDTFLIPTEPRHLVAHKQKICSRTNAHIIIEFGIEILQSMLKREIVKNKSYRPYLDPFVPVIKNCLESQHTRLVILSLKCLIYLLKRDLPSLNSNVASISDSVFTILAQYSSAGVSGQNAELLMSATKVALVLMRDLKLNISNEQLRILLFVAEDLQKNVSLYGTGFSLLKAIVGRQFNLSEIHELMAKTAEMSITSYNDNVRSMARKVYYSYLTTYPHGKKLQNLVMFFSSQLKYAEVSGRKSALEMLTVVSRAFPVDTLKEMSSLLFVQLAFRLLNDDSAECKKMASDCISIIISRFQETKQEKELLEFALIWMNEKKTTNRRLGVQLLSIFVSVKREKFEATLKEVLPLIENQFHYNQANDPGKFVKIRKHESKTNHDEENDELYFVVLQLYKIIIEVCPAFLISSSFVENVQNLSVSCHNFLRHSHAWVRISSLQILGLIFNTLDAFEVAKVIIDKSLAKCIGFLKDEQTKEQVRILCLDLVDQLAPGHDVLEALLKQTMKNLLFLAEVLQHIPTTNKKELSLPWLVNRLMKQIFLEVYHAPKNYAVRTIVFNWLAALAVKLQDDKISSILSLVLTPIFRELTTTDEQGADIRRIAKEVLKYYREKCTSADYDATVTKIKRTLDIKRVKRKSKVTQLAVVHPERAAVRKQRIREKKKEQRKRRLEKLRKRAFKSSKRKLAVIKD